MAQMEKPGLAALLDLAEGSGVIQLDWRDVSLRSASLCTTWISQCAKQARVNLLLQLFQLNQVLKNICFYQYHGNGIAMAIRT